MSDWVGRYSKTDTKGRLGLTAKTGNMGTPSQQEIVVPQELEAFFKGLDDLAPDLQHPCSLVGA